MYTIYYIIKTGDNYDTISTKVHHTILYKDKRGVTIPINRLVPERYFVIRTPVGEVVTHGYDKIHKYS